MSLLQIGDPDILAEAESVFWDKVKEYNEEGLMGHRSRYVRLNDEFVMLITWHDSWSYTIYFMEDKGHRSGQYHKPPEAIPSVFNIQRGDM